jgi:MSHA biogenesis protein MshP
MALVAVIFIMVIMSGAVLMMSRLADMQAAERTLDLLGARAQFSAQAGLEWAMYEVFANTGCPTSPSTLTMHSETDLAGFSVVVTCVARPYTEGLNDVILYDVQSEASTSNFSSTGEYVFRRVSAVVEMGS